MKRFLITLTTVTGLCYYYSIHSLSARPTLSFILFIPFLLIWLLPVLYWGRGEKKDTGLRHFIHYAGYLSMAFISFLIVFLAASDLLSFLYPFPHKDVIVLSISVLALVIGHLIASLGPSLLPVTIKIKNLPSALEGFTIAHITDLHIGPTIRKNYVEKVVAKTLSQNTDLIVLTGDIADGDLKKYGVDSEPLKLLGETGRAWMVPGNHDYYSGWEEWKNRFKALGIRTLENEYVILKDILLGGVTDPASSTKPDPLKAVDSKSTKFKILLAHNPKLAIPSASAGFQLMLSGHTHAGQFFPWTLVVRMVHRPHYGGLSEEGNMKVYVGPGTGTWGPPVRLGTTPEITIITLSSAES